MIKKIDHFVITTSDLKACAKFYEGLGFTLEDHGNYECLVANDFKINVHLKNHELEPKASHVTRGSADFCFEVDDSISELKSKLEKQGYQIEEGPVTRFGRHGEMTSIYLRDFDGNLVELAHYE
ncbi:MAG: VOC family protein [Erysipelotrichaceae bacterium]